MNKHGTTAILAAVCLLAGCADNSKKDGCTNCDHEHPSGTAAGTAAPAPAVFVAEPPTGEATPIPEARKKLKPGDEVLLRLSVSGTLRKYTRDGEATVEPTGSADLECSRAFINAINTGDRSGIRSDLADATRTLKVTLAANKAAGTGEVVFLA